MPRIWTRIYGNCARLNRSRKPILIRVTNNYVRHNNDAVAKEILDIYGEMKRRKKE